MSELWRFHSVGDAYFDLPGNAGQWPANERRFGGKSEVKI